MTAFHIALKGAPPNSVLIYVRLYNDLLVTYDRATKIQTIHSRLVSSLRILNTTSSSTQQTFFSKGYHFSSFGFTLRLNNFLLALLVSLLDKESSSLGILLGDLNLNNQRKYKAFFSCE